MSKVCILWVLKTTVFLSLTMSSSILPLHHNWTRSEKMDPNGILHLQWHIKNMEIVFKATVNSRGFVAIGFVYENPEFSFLDIALAWVDDRSNKVNILVSFNHLYYAFTKLEFFKLSKKLNKIK